MSAEGRKELPLPEAVTDLLQECRMVLPGVQTLFGFQLIVVYNDGFAEKLSSTEQHLHLLALGLVAIAIALIMTPAAYHRQTPLEVSQSFVTIATRLLLSAMFPLMLAIALDFYLIGRVILANGWLSGLLTAVLVSLFAGLWFVFPRLATGKKRPSGRK